MKQSRYNIICSKGNYSYWINTLSFKYFRFSRGLGEKIESLISTPEVLDENLPDLYKKLCEAGFFVADEIDEIEEVRKLHENSINSKHAFLIIMPTLDCNYKCWYCIQNHIPSKMNEEVINNIKQFVRRLIKEEGIESLSVDWFGGEPLMYLEEIVEPLSLYMKEECEKANIPFFNGATTNGFFLYKMIEKIEDLSFTRYQITLDGNREFHDKVKFTEGCFSTFNHVLKNIDKALALNPSLRVVLRINYTHENLNENIVEEINEFVRPENRARTVIMPRKVWQESVDKSYPAILNSILNRFSENGYPVERWTPSSSHVSCYANQKYYTAICPDGHTVKCTACDDIYKSETGGQLMTDGTIEWKGDYEKRYLEPTFENQRCISCRRLPLCMGLCPRAFNDGGDYCKYSAVDTNFEDSMMAFIDSIYDQFIAKHP